MGAKALTGLHRPVGVRPLQPRAQDAYSACAWRALFSFEPLPLFLFRGVPVWEEVARQPAGTSGFRERPYAALLGFYVADGSPINAWCDAGGPRKTLLTSAIAGGRLMDLEDP